MIRRLVPFILAVMAAPLALAQESEPRWYQVEIVVFLNQTAGRVTHEDWSRDPGRPDMTDAVTLQPIPEAAAGLMPFQLLSPEELELSDMAQKLERSGHYKPLLHTGWREPAEADQTVFPPVIIEAPLETPDPEAAVQSATATPPDGGSAAAGQGPSLAPIAPAAAAEPTPPSPGIEGTVRLRVSRYLHLDVDLLYSKELPLPPEMLQARGVVSGDAPLGSESPVQAPSPQPWGSSLMIDFLGMPSTYIQSYRLTEQRRMRRDELHYFDHPQFGVLAKVSAYELPAAAATPVAAPAKPALPVPVVNPGKATSTPLR